MFWQKSIKYFRRTNLPPKTDPLSKSYLKAIILNKVWVQPTKVKVENQNKVPSTNKGIVSKKQFLSTLSSLKSNLMSQSLQNLNINPNLK